MSCFTYCWFRGRIYFALFLCLLLLSCGGSSSDGGNENPEPIGLSERPSNLTCIATQVAQNTDIRLVQVAEGPASSPTIFFAPHPTRANIYYVVQQRGAIYQVDLMHNSRSELIDLSEHYALSGCGECGLLGFAFHPDFSDNGYLYLSFTEENNGMQSYVARFRSDDNGHSLVFENDTPVRENIYQVSQPYSNHNGGHILFGPDNLLYLGLGDGGAGDDPDNNGQDILTALGSMIRLNDDGTPAADNNVPGALPEIYAYGLRNPWRFSFDRQTGELWLGDVGQSAVEEINIIESGGNYGWRCFEGSQMTSNSCSSNGPYIDPVAEYGRSEGFSVTGGYVYRGTEILALQGSYIFGDFGSGTIWRVTGNSVSGYERSVLLDSGLNIASFAEGANGELFVVGIGGGVYRIESDVNQTPVEQPANLSETGCFLTNDPTQPVSGIVPYDINESFWSDGAEKKRFLGIPDGRAISINSSGDFSFPVGTVLIKEFELNNRRIETRLLMHSELGRWQGYSYRWNADQTDAVLLPGALTENIAGQVWHYPSGAQCSQCHTEAAGFSLGLEAQQINREFEYPRTGIVANQLETLAAIGMFSSNVDDSNRALLLPTSSDVSVSIANRARSYLHSNCSHCHRPGATTQSNMNLLFSTDFIDMNICNELPQNGELGIDGAVLFSPGQPELSLIYQRIVATNQNRMPPIASNVVDIEGAEVLRVWIESVNECF